MTRLVVWSLDQNSQVFPFESPDGILLLLQLWLQSVCAWVLVLDAAVSAVQVVTG